MDASQQAYEAAVKLRALLREMMGDDDKSGPEESVKPASEPQKET